MGEVLKLALKFARAVVYDELHALSVYLFMKRHSILVLFATFALCSCVPGDKTDSSFASSQSQSTLPMSSVATTSEHSSESRFSSMASFSSEQSSSGARRSSSVTSSSPLSSSSSSSPDSLDDNDYCSVSIYQSYPEYNLGHMKGEIRFDKTIKVVCGQPLYSTGDEVLDFEGRLDEVYHPRGGTWFTHYLFCDPECTTYYLSGTPILEDSSFYYYCTG